MGSTAHARGLPAPTGRMTAARIRAAVASAHGERTRATTVVDLLLVVGCLGYALWSIEVNDSLWPVLPTWWVPLDVGVGVVAALALWWRRSHPVVIATLLAVLGGVFISAGPAAIVAVYTVATLRRTSIAVSLTALHLAIAIPYFLFVPVGGYGIGVWAVLMILLYTSVLAIGLAVRARRQVIAGLVAAADAQRADEERRTNRAREAERARIAREMHDVLAHRLSILSVHAGALEHRVRGSGSDPTPAELQEAAAVIRSSAHVALEELRDVLDLLGSTSRSELGTGTPQPLLADLDHLVEDAAGAGQCVDLRRTGDAALDEAKPQLQRTVFRVVQEGLTNARKHAPSAAVDVEIATSAVGVRVTVSNAVPVGVTRAEVPGSQAGLTGLAERLRLDGGTLTVGVDDGRFVLTAELPWRR